MPKKKEQHNHLVIEGELTIYTVLEWKDRLLAALVVNDELEIDLSAVDEFDAAGLQLLIVAKQGSMTLGRILRITGHSPVVLNLLELSGLVSFFGDSLLAVKDINEAVLA